MHAHTDVLHVRPLVTEGARLTFFILTIAVTPFAVGVKLGRQDGNSKHSIAVLVLNLCNWF